MSLLKLDIFTECELNYFIYSINIYWASVLIVHFRGRNKSVMILKISAYLDFTCWIRLYFHRKTNQFTNFLICLISDTKCIISFSIISQNLWQSQCSRPLLILQFFFSVSKTMYAHPENVDQCVSSLRKVPPAEVNVLVWFFSQHWKIFLMQRCSTA